MIRNIGDIDTQRAINNFADWTDRIAAGELPKSKPSRPLGLERNVVITLWDWGGPKDYLHDEIASDKRNPLVNANGPIYGAMEESADYMPVVVPGQNNATQVKLEVRDPKTPRPGAPTKGSAYWGDEAIWTAQTTAHSFARAASIRPCMLPLVSRQMARSTEGCILAGTSTTGLVALGGAS